LKKSVSREEKEKTRIEKWRAYGAQELLRPHGATLARMALRGFSFFSRLRESTFLAFPGT
jgi:hypothetical protein